MRCCMLGRISSINVVQRNCMSIICIVCSGNGCLDTEQSHQRKKQNRTYTAIELRFTGDYCRRWSRILNSITSGPPSTEIPPYGLEIVPVFSKASHICMHTCFCSLKITTPCKHVQLQSFSSLLARAASNTRP